MGKKQERCQKVKVRTEIKIYGFKELLEGAYLKKTKSISRHRPNLEPFPSPIDRFSALRLQFPFILPKRPDRDPAGALGTIPVDEGNSC